MNRKLIEWEKVFAYNTFDKGLISKIYTTQQQKRLTIQLKSEQKIWIDIFPKKKYRWPRDIWEDAQDHWSSEKCKLNHNETSPHTCHNGYHR